MNGHRFAVQLMIAQAVLFAAETAIIHRIGSHVPIMELAFLRAGAGVLLAFIIARRASLQVAHTKQLALQILRGAVSAAYLWVMIYSFGHLPFADATAISYTQAPYIALFSVLILGETVTAARWLAAAIGIMGALLIAKPTFGQWNSAYLVALLGTGLNGLSFVLNRYLQREDSEATTLFYSNLVPLLANAPVLLLVETPTADTLTWLPCILLLGPLGMYAGIVALRYANASVLGPYTLLRLVIAVVAGLIVFHEMPDILAASGVALILGSCMLSSSAGAAMRLSRCRHCRLRTMMRVDPNSRAGAGIWVR